MTRNEWLTLTGGVPSEETDCSFQRRYDENAVNNALENIRLVKRIESRFHFNDRNSMFNRVLVDEFGEINSRTPLHTFDF